MACRGQSGLIGVYIPTAWAASSSGNISAQLTDTTATASPRRTPNSASTAAARCTSAASSAYVRTSGASKDSALGSTDIAVDGPQLGRSRTSSYVLAKTGKLFWTQSLWTGLAGSRLIYGYASSPLAYRDLILLPVGGAGQALAAFRQADGSIAWKKDEAGNAYSSPLLINVDGLDQVVQLMRASVFGVNPLNGDLQWFLPHDTPYGLNVSTPVWGAGNLLFVASGYGAGSRVIGVKRSGNSISAKQVWYSNRVGLHHGNAMRIGDAMYFSSGNGPAPFTAIDVRTGNVLWQSREFPKVTMVYADSKLIVLDEDGGLAVAQVSSQGLRVMAKTTLLSNNAWTPPTLVGTKLYIRDRKTMTAVELAA